MILTMAIGYLLSRVGPPPDPSKLSGLVFGMETSESEVPVQSDLQIP